MRSFMSTPWKSALRSTPVDAAQTSQTEHESPVPAPVSPSSTGPCPIELGNATTCTHTAVDTALLPGLRSYVLHIVAANDETRKKIRVEVEGLLNSRNDKQLDTSKFRLVDDLLLASSGDPSKLESWEYDFASRLNSWVATQIPITACAITAAVVDGDSNAAKLRNDAEIASLCFEATELAFSSRAAEEDEGSGLALTEPIDSGELEVVAPRSLSTVLNDLEARQLRG